jgi:hypothetical protein
MLAAQVAAYERWARTPQAERTAHGKRGQAGLIARFEREIDPDGTLPPEERARQVDRLYRAHMARVRLARSKAGAARKAGATPLTAIAGLGWPIRGQLAPDPR